LGLRSVGFAPSQNHANLSSVPGAFTSSDVAT
jgi:hypothetical protein